MNLNLKLAVIDYGAGNLHSLLKALHYLGVEASMVQTPQDIARADRLILPGVGAFPSGMKGLEKSGLVESIQAAAEAGKPILGICLGAQLMMSDGYEFEPTKGLGLLEGNVVKFPKLVEGYRVPDINWNTLEFPKGKSGRFWEDSILESTTPRDRVYFVHSFVFEPENKNHILAETTYGGHQFCSVFKKDNLVGCQFHPEKSGEVGLGILREFLAMG